MASLRDWGNRLEIALYIEAVCHFLGGDEQTVGTVPLSREGSPLGNQSMFLLDPDTAFRITAFPANIDQYQRSLRALLNASHLSALQWVNLGRHKIQFISLLRNRT